MTQLSQHFVEHIKVSTGINTVEIEAEHSKGRDTSFRMFLDEEELSQAEALESIIDSAQEALEKLEAEDE